MEVSLGLDRSFSANLKQVLRVLMSFSSPSNSSDNSGQSGSRHFLSCENMSVGVPIAYSKGLARITHALLLEFDGLRISKEDIFFLIYALTGAGSKRYVDIDLTLQWDWLLFFRKAIRNGPFRAYFALYPFAEESSGSPGPQTFADDIPYTIRDSMYVRAAVEILHPKKAEVLRIAGVHVEEILFGCLNSLFAGFLPTQSLFRLWDILFNVMFCPQLIESTVTYGELQARAQEQLVKDYSRSRLLNPCNINGAKTYRNGITSINSPTQVKNLIFIKKKYFLSLSSIFISLRQNDRRILLSFCFSLLTTVLSELPSEPTPKEIKQALTCRLLSLRDPSEIVAMISKADFVLFTSPLHYQYITELSEHYINVSPTSAVYWFRDWECKYRNSVIFELIIWW